MGLGEQRLLEKMGNDFGGGAALIRPMADASLVLGLVRQGSKLPNAPSGGEGAQQRKMIRRCKRVAWTMIGDRSNLQVLIFVTGGCG